MNFLYASYTWVKYFAVQGVEGGEEPPDKMYLNQVKNLLTTDNS